MSQHPREITRDEQVFRPSDLAARWGVSENTVRAEIERGALRAFRIGKLYRIKAGAVEEYECRTIQSVTFSRICGTMLIIPKFTEQERT